MRSIEELIGPVRRLKTAGRSLDTFCGHLAATGPALSRSSRFSVEDIAREFRQFFCLPVPVSPALGPLLQDLGIMLARHGNDKDPDACADFNTETQRWELLVRFDVGRRESLCILREVWTVLAAQCGQCLPWWEDGLAASRTALRNAADRFAYAVVLPPSLFQQRALDCGLNPWTLAQRFMTVPGACFQALQRQLTLPFPYFQAQLNFCPGPPLQTRMFFAAQSVRAEVWRKAIRRAQGRAAGAWPEMETLAAAFPRTGAILEADGVLYRAIRTCRPQWERTDHIAGIQLPAPVCVVARPNGAAQSQMFVQVVPLAQEAVLMDDALRDSGPEPV